MIGVRGAMPGDEPDVRRLAAAARAAIAEAKGGAQLLADLDPIDAIVDELDGVVVGTVGGAVVGYGVTRVSGARGVLAELFVEAAARGVGVGAAILGEAQVRLTAAGCTGIDSQALPGDRATKNFFEAHGMVTRLLVTHRRLPVSDATG